VIDSSYLKLIEAFAGVLTLNDFCYTCKGAHWLLSLITRFYTLQSYESKVLEYVLILFQGFRFTIQCIGVIYLFILFYCQIY